MVVFVLLLRRFFLTLSSYEFRFATFVFARSLVSSVSYSVRLSLIRFRSFSPLLRLVRYYISHSARRPCYLRAVVWRHPTKGLIGYCEVSL